MISKPKKRAYVETYGCQMNISDGELMEGVLAEQGYEIASTPEDADVILAPQLNQTVLAPGLDLAGAKDQDADAGKVERIELVTDALIVTAVDIDQATGPQLGANTMQPVSKALLMVLAPAGAEPEVDLNPLEAQVGDVEEVVGQALHVVRVDDHDHVVGQT